jgi:spore maturation protein CgeB
MRILLVGENWHGSLVKSCYEALIKLAHETTIFDFRREFELNAKFSSFPILGRFEWSYRREITNRKLSDTCISLKPDVLLVFKGELITPETLKKIKQKTGAILCNWNPDDPFNKVNSSRDLIKCIPLYDIYFIWGKFLIPEIRQAGVKRVEYLPFGYDTHLHHPVNLTDEEYKLYGSDIVFIGTWDREREEILQSITDFDLGVWGNAWENVTITAVKKCWKSNARYGEEMSKICNASKIVLNLVRRQNGNAHNMRTFEVPACGGFMMAKRTQEQIEFLEDGKGIVSFGNIDELKEKIKYYLIHEEERKEITRYGMEKVLYGGHSYVDRMRYVVDYIKEL